MTISGASKRIIELPASMRRDAAWQASFEQACSTTTAPVLPALAAAGRSGFVLTPAALRDVGVDPALVRRELNRGRWYRPARGAICVLRAATVAGVGDCAAEQMEAVGAAVLRPGTAISHESAAVVHALPVLRRLDRPSITTIGRTTGGDGVPSSLVRAARLDPHEVTEWFGAPVTTAARTVLDIARSSGRRSGLVAADAALHAGLVTTAQLRAATRDRAHWPGIRRARQVIELADGRAESALESLLRLLAHDHGLPNAVPQVWVDTATGRYRVDLGWPARRVAVEADGALKYRDDPDALWLEKQRQEAIERAGWIVVRVTWADVYLRPRQTADRIAAALFRRR